jgi:hypothetical protein
MTEDEEKYDAWSEIIAHYKPAIEKSKRLYF